MVVVSGLPGSGKSTLLRRLSRAVDTVDPRDAHEACEAVMPARLPYAVYRPWARLRHVNRLRQGVREGGPLLVHDCGSRAWMRRWLARSAGRQGRELHLVLLDVGAAEALAGQEARGRWASRRVFARHRQGLGRAAAGNGRTDAGGRRAGGGGGGRLRRAARPYVPGARGRCGVRAPARGRLICPTGMDRPPRLPVRKQTGPVRHGC
ncbi:hypothetical protein GCM10020000_00550 [Streptomyces olivoverticillatus]